MTRDSTGSGTSSTEGEHFLCYDWFDPLENGVRTRIRRFIEELLEAELDAALGRARYERPGVAGGEAPKPSATPTCDPLSKLAGAVAFARFGFGFLPIGDSVSGVRCL